MPKGYFDVLVPHPTHIRFIMVDSQEVDYLTSTDDDACVIHLKDGQLIYTPLPSEDVQGMLDDARRQLDY
jgi:hypothetical protein